MSESAAAGEVASNTRAPFNLRWVFDLVAIATLLLVGVIAWAPSFTGGRAWLAGVGALIIGLAVAALGARLRLGTLALAGATVLSYFVFGGALALREQALFGFLPSLDTLRELALAAVFSWKQLLTSQAPLPGEDPLVVVVFLTTLLASVLAGSFALRLPRAFAWAVLPPAALLMVAIAFGLPHPAAPLLQGALFVGVAVAWLAYRGNLLRGTGRGAVAEGQGSSTLARSATVRRLGLGAGVLVVALVAGGATSAIAGLESPRYVLRDVVIPPFDVREYPSPLQSFRGYVRDAKDQVLFTVDGLPEGARVRLATMDAYDGVVYNVSGNGAGGSGSFLRVGERISPAGATKVEGKPATLNFTMGALGGVWVPDAGYPTRLAFEGKRSDDLARSLHYNPGSGVAVVTSGLREGDSYEMDTVIPGIPSDTALADAVFAGTKMPKQTGIPLTAASTAGDLTGDADTPIAQARALAAALSTTGFFSHGLEGEPRSRAGHGAERLDALLGEDQMVGDDEQYATAMAVMASQLGIPARVVMGFYPDPKSTGASFAATGDTLHVWVEVAFQDLGWVVFDPTPPDDQVPTDEDTKPRTDPKPQVIQPPPPPQEPVQLPPEIPADDGENDDDPAAGEWLTTLLWAVGGSLGVLLVLAAPFFAILVLKLGRRKRRRARERTADQISGGWDEFVDRVVDLGAPVPPRGTRRSGALAVEDHFAVVPGTGEMTESASGGAAIALADRADAEVFGPGDPSAEDVEAFWHDVDASATELASTQSKWRQLRARVSPRSLRRKERK